MKIKFFSRSVLGSLVVALALTCWQSCKTEDPTALVPPQITRISPQSGFVGNTLSISGKGFASEPAKNMVIINSSVATVQEVQSDTLIKVVVPETATSGAVQVIVNKQRAYGPLFTVPRNPNPPTLTSITPTEVEPGDVLTLKGTNFKTGAELDQNTVRISGLKVKILSGNETELKVAVPGVPKQPTVPVTVAVLGTPSNELPLKVNGFEGKLIWVSASAGISNAPAYRVVANADGSSLERQVALIPAAQKEIFEGLDFQKNLRFYSYDSKNKVFYLLKQLGGVGRAEVFQADNTLTNFKQIYSLEDGVNPYGFATSESNNGFYYSVSGEDQKELYEGFYNGNGVIKLKLKIPPDSPLVSNIVVGSSTFIEYKDSGENNFYIYSLTGAPRKKVTIPTFSGKDFFSAHEACFNPADGNYYFVGVLFDFNIRYNIYRVPETGGTAELLINVDSKVESAGQYEPRNLQVLSTPSGVKLFWISREPEDGANRTDAIYFASIKGAPPYNAVPLYNKPEEIVFDPRTRPDFVGGSPSSFVPFFYAIAN
jgi:hypothetical protein